MVLNIRGDNVGALVVCIKMRPANATIAIMARELALRLTELSFPPDAVHTPGVAHGLADRLSGSMHLTDLVLWTKPYIQPLLTRSSPQSQTVTTHGIERREKLIPPSAKGYDRGPVFSLFEWHLRKWQARFNA